ncbi:MAG: hypothetical protein ABI670_20435 [Chloroflexota bacterium]
MNKPGSEQQAPSTPTPITPYAIRRREVLGGIIYDYYKETGDSQAA